MKERLSLPKSARSAATSSALVLLVLLCVPKGLLDLAPLEHRVEFLSTRYRALLPLLYLPSAVVSDVLLFYEKLERLADFCRRLSDGEDVGGTVSLDPPGPVPVTRSRIAGWEIQAVAKTNRARGEKILSRLTQRSVTLTMGSLLQHLGGRWRRQAS